MESEMENGGYKNNMKSMWGCYPSIMETQMEYEKNGNGVCTGAYGDKTVHAPKNWMLGTLVTAIVVQVLGEYMVIGHLEPQGKVLFNA